MQHKDLAKGRWFTLTLAEQLGNAGSEFERALAARAQGDSERFARAAERFYELMNLTVADPRWRGLRRREIARAKEQSTEVLESGNSEAAGLQRYFMQFAFLAREKF
ncbi:MAG: hypothetical protein Q8P97_01940 [bacterium]|nr:hypothetical protein [bacterium]